MSDETDLVGIMQPSSRVRSLRRALDVVTERLQPVLDLSRPYVDGLRICRPTGDSCWWVTTLSSAPRSF